MSSNLYNDICKLQNINYEISYSSKKINLDSANVLDCQITWDVNDISILGALVFQDTGDIFSMLPPHAKMLLTIKYKQHMSPSNADTVFDFEKTFSITRIEKGVKGSTKSTLNIEFIDAHYFYMTRRYKSKGYKNIKFSAVLKEVLEEFTDVKTTVSSNETKIEHEALIVPSNKSFANFLYNMEYIDGFTLVNDKTGFNIFNHVDYMSVLQKFSKASSFTLTTAQDDENNPFYIKEYKFLMLDSFAMNSMIPNTVVSNMNYKTKQLNEALVLNDKLTSTLKNDDTPLVGSTMTEGFKRIEYHTDNFKDYMTRLHAFKLLETHLIEVTVSGNIIYNLYDIININISNPVEGVTNVNLLNSGKYVILRIVDKINGTFFNQIITLGRVGVKYK